MSLFVLGAFIYSGRVYLLWARLFVLSAYALRHPLVNITHGHPWPPLDPCRSTSATIAFLSTFPSTIPHVLLTVPVAPSLSVTTLTPTVAAPAILTILVDHMNVLHTLHNRHLVYSRDLFVTFSEGLLEAPGLEDDPWCDEYTDLKH